jgi:hypothetical protein
MASYVLIHGGGDTAWHWRLLAAELRARGHDVVAPDLPYEDDTAGLAEYADTVVDAIGDRRDLVVVAHSRRAGCASTVGADECQQTPYQPLHGRNQERAVTAGGSDQPHPTQVTFSGAANEVQRHLGHPVSREEGRRTSSGAACQCFKLPIPTSH